MTTSPPTTLTPPHDQFDQDHSSSVTFPATTLTPPHDQDDSSPGDDGLPSPNPGGMTRTMLTSVDFRFSGNSSRKNSAVFVPFKVSAKQLQSIVADVWQMPAPNMLISVDAGSAHPSELATKDLCLSKEYRNWAQQGREQTAQTEARRTGVKPPPSPRSNSTAEETKRRSSSFFSANNPMLKRASASMMEAAGLNASNDPITTSDMVNRALDATSTSPEDFSEITDEQYKVVNNLLFQKLVTVFCAILDAAAMSNNWIIVDRTRPDESSTTAELLLELAIRQTNQRPAVVVIESLKRFSSFTSRASQNHVNALMKLASASTPISADGESTSSEVQVIPNPYSPEDFDTPGKFHDLKLPCPPFKEHLRGPTGTVAPKRKWMYHYSETTFSSGTHYIFLEGEVDSFPLYALGPVGYVHAHGGTLAYKRLRSRISQGKQLVMLHQTGGATQAFASLHKALTAPLAHRKSTEQLLNEVDIFSGELWAGAFGVPEIMMFKELISRAPQLFFKTILSVDLVNASAEQTLTTVTGCFANSNGGIPELGLGDAEQTMIFNAWERHLLLWNNSRRLRNHAHFMYFFLSITAFATALFSVIYANAEIVGGFDEDAMWLNQENFGNLLVILPIVTALVGTIRTRLRFVDKWKICEMASFQIVNEIYQFRTRVGRYGDLSRSDEEDKSDMNGKGSKLSAVNKSHCARERFTERVIDIWSSVLESDVGTSGTIIYSEKRLYDPEEKHQYSMLVMRHLATNIYMDERRNVWGCWRGMREGEGVGGLRNGEEEGEEDDDLVSHMPIESYIRNRAMHARACFRNISPQLNSKAISLELTGFCVTSFGAMLAIVGKAEWVSLVVATGAILANVSEYFGFARERSAVNSGLKEVENLFAWWGSLSVVDRRTVRSKEIAVSMTEDSVIAWANARTSSAANNQGKNAKADELGEDGKGGDGEGGGGGGGAAGVGDV